MEDERVVVSNTKGAPGEGNQSPKAGAAAGPGAAPMRGKSCKGFLYYSSTLKSKSRNPVCCGFTRSLPQEVQASKDGRSLADFKYGCAGYSVYPNRKNNSEAVQETQMELPVCVGIEVLVDRRVTTASDSAPALVHDKVHDKDGHAIPQPRTQKPAHAVGEDFMSRFTRNASLVANGVAKNVCKVGNQLKESVEDLYPYRRRPK